MVGRGDTFYLKLLFNWPPLERNRRRNSPYIPFLFTEFHSFAGRLCHSGWRQTYNVRKIFFPVPVLHFWSKL